MVKINTTALKLGIVVLNWETYHYVKFKHPIIPSGGCTNFHQKLNAEQLFFANDSNSYNPMHAAWSFLMDSISGNLISGI